MPHITPHFRIALVTCAEVPELDADTARVIAPLAARGIEAVPATWSDAGVDWSAYHLAVIRSCWDYVARYDEFHRWTRRVSRLANTPDTVAWNTDKRYLQRLANAGIVTVPTRWLGAGTRWDLPHDAEVVIKPAISLCSLDTGRYRLPQQRALADAHVQRILASGREVMVQPYVGAIDTIGETSLVFFGGTFSHAIRKNAVLDGPDAGIDRRFEPAGGMTVERCEPTPAQRAIAARVIGLAPSVPLYARVDLVGEQLMELELTEPNLFLASDAGAAERFAESIAEWVERDQQRRKAS